MQVFRIYNVVQKVDALQFVENQTRDTLLPIIETIVLTGSVIYSDE